MSERDHNREMLRSEQADQRTNQIDGRDGQQLPTSGYDSESNGDGRSGNTGTVRKSNRGFAAMSPERQRAIASEGGRAAHRQGVAHEWSSDEAREAGRKGGQIVSRNREHMSEIGRKGGQRSGSKRSKQQ